jgi:acetylornithine deacetylase
VPFVTLNVAQVAGGAAVNVIPDRCVIDVGLRLLPGMARDPMIARVRSVVEDVAGGEGLTFELVNESPPMLLDATADIYHAASAEAGQEGEHTIAYTTDGGWLERSGLECVICGPGSIEVAHRPNEFVPIEQLTRADGFLQRMIQRFCAS